MTNIRLIPVTQWNKYHDYPTVSGLRWLIYRAGSEINPNGFDKCIRRIGRRVLIDEAAFFEWVTEQNSKSARGGGG